MGLLDDAIREHLDLKRRRGADPAEIERAERDALGPVRRDPVGSDEAANEHPAMPDDHLGYEDESVYDQGFEEPPQFDAPVASEPPVAPPPPTAAEPPVAPPPELEYTLDQETEVWDEFEPDAPGLVDAPHRARAPEPADPLDDEPLAQAPPEPYAAPPVPEEPVEPPPAPEPLREPEPPRVDPEATQQHTTEPPPSPASPPADPGPAAHDDPLGSDTAEYDLELTEVEGEDVLEETPEFLQDTPDHDRLWFEQRPPKDFDFDE